MVKKQKRKSRGSLSPEQIVELLNKYETGSWTQPQLAKEYGISRSWVHRLIHQQIIKMPFKRATTRRDLMLALNEQSKIIASLEVQLDRAFIKWDSINARL